MTQPDVSVVVCSYNRSASLRRALESLAALDTGGRFSYEVVVVDNASTDDTADVVRAVAASAAVPIRPAYEPKHSLGAARNRGVAEARGHWIAYFDDDQLADPNWLLELLAMAGEKGALCVGGAVDLHLPPGVGRKLSVICCRVLGATSGMDRPCRYTRKIVPGTGNVMFHRIAFARAGLFSTELAQAGEDIDLYRRVHAAGIESWYAPKALIHHVIPPHRLADDYFRWCSLRVGMNFAQRDRLDRGPLGMVWTLCGRLVQAGLLSLPRAIWLRLRGAREEALGVRCLLWRFEGYLRYAMHALIPKMFAQREFFGRLNFRSERSTLLGKSHV
jgi:glycosyltransferase involved in cell wall biosynthesis